MKPVRVNITLPAEFYEELRAQAFKRRTPPTTLAQELVVAMLTIRRLEGDKKADIHAMHMRLAEALKP